MRPLHILLVILLALAVIDSGLYLYSTHNRVRNSARDRVLDIATAGLGLTDLCISTEARYTRHPAVIDRVVPFMDHPGAIEHFPTGSFWSPPFRQTM
jgi:hypothetical protein